MKTLTKILILFGAVVLAVGAVLLFMRIIMSPPYKMAEENQYLDYLGKTTRSFKDSTVADPEPMFQKMTDVTDRFGREKKITDAQKQEQYADFIIVYSPKLADWIKKSYNEDEWPESRLDFIVRRVDYIRNLKGDDNSPVVSQSSPEVFSELGELQAVVGRYHEAKGVGASGFNGITDARTKIQKSREYLDDPYLKNNVKLRNSLTSLPSRLEAAHYGSLKSRVAGLANFKGKSQQTYNSQVQGVRAAVNEYQTNASAVYGHVSDVNSLYSQINKYQANAREHYQRIEDDIYRRINAEEDDGWD